MQPNYRDDWDITKLMRKLHGDGNLDTIQDRFWSGKRPAEELYNTQNDSHEINNLANDPKFVHELKRHRDILEKWIQETDDKGQYPEDEANMKYMYDWWGDKCVNPEYNRFRKKG